METEHAKYRKWDSQTILWLAVVILVISLGAVGLAGYTFFIVLPPALDNVNTAAWNLINFHPKNDFSDSAYKVREAGNNLQNVGNQIGGLGGLPFVGGTISSIGANLNSMGSQIQSLADNVQNTGNTFDSTVNVINSVGYGALGVKDGLYYGVMTMLVFGGVGVLTGVTLMVVGRSIARL